MTPRKQALNRQKVNDLQFCGMSSNEKKADDERIKTLGVVMHRYALVCACLTAGVCLRYTLAFTLALFALA